MKFKKAITRVLYHVAGWILLYLLPALALQTEVKLPTDFGHYMFWFIVIICFYINYIWLIPLFLSKRKFLHYFLFTFLMLVFTYSANELYDMRVNKKDTVLKYSAGNINRQHQKKSPRYRGYNSVLFCFAILGLGTSIRVTQNWYENEKQKKEMENQKLGAELSLLKSQINPHFFFNTLNSIYSLAIIKSDKTPEAIIKLSGIMRYIIYNTERKLVPLSKEVEYIANYIELQQLRLPVQIKVVFITDLQKESVIEPLLILPFVENAFKHATDTEKGGTILVSVTQVNNQLKLHVENPLSDNGSDDNSDTTGTWMSNTLRRLQLLYDKNFSLTTGPVNNQYVIDLILKLKDDEVFDS
jgi:two-component system, LytTR family, sensor kinase